MTDENVELHAIFRGRVQGIGFRWTVADHAERFHLTGSVKNLLDGTVEAHMQGEKEVLERFLASVRAESGFARINSVSAQYQEITHPATSLEILI
ncbi:MAG: Acylphosphatase [Chlamydiae bacterium]|nr:Acylphosphatase [Chlamydiota bacterium]